MKYKNTSRVDVLTEPGIRDSEEYFVKIADKLWDKIVQGNLEGKIKFGLSVMYFVSFVYFTIQLFA